MKTLFLLGLLLFAVVPAVPVHAEEEALAVRDVLDATAAPGAGAPEAASPQSGDAVAAAPAAAATPGTPGTPRAITADMYLEKLTKFDPTAGTYEAELLVSVQTADLAGFKPEFDLVNGIVRKTEELESGEASSRLFRLSVEVSFEPDFKRFPLDEQDLDIQLTIAGASVADVKFTAGGTPDETRNDDKVKIAGWELEVDQPTAGEEASWEGGEKQPVLTLPVSITRTRFPALLKTFFPLSIMLLISFLGLFIGVSLMNIRISMMTGTLLGAAMFHMNAISSLPMVGYVTFADKIFIATYLSVLLNTFYSILMHRAKEGGRDATVTTAMGQAKIVVPLATLVMYVVALFV